MLLFLHNRFISFSALLARPGRWRRRASRRAGWSNRL